MADTTAGDIRSVIKNATQGGLARNGGLGMKKAGGVTGQGDTIATKKEIETEKADNSLSPRPTIPSTNVGQRLQTSTTPKTPVSTQPQNVLQKEMQSNEVIAPASQQTVGTFQNATVQPIKNIKIEGLGNHDISLRKGVQTPKVEEKKNPLIETEGEKTKRMSDGVYALYVDAYNKGQQGGTLTVEDVLGNKNYQKQFYGVDQKLVQDMVNDANLIAQYDYDDQNALYLMDKYKNLGLSLDFEKLSHPNKGRVLDNMATDEGAGGIWGLVDTFTPFNIAEWFGGKVMGEKNKKAVEDNIQGFRNFLDDQEIEMLTDEEVAKYVADDIAKLDKAYAKYYHNVYEQIFNDSKVGQQFYKDVAALQKKNKDMTEEEAINEVMKNGTYNGVAYEKLPHTSTDQGRFWDDKEKEKEYNKKVKELKSAIKDEHDNKNAFFGNATVNNAIVRLAQVPLFAYDIAKKPGTFAKSLYGMGKGAIHKSIEGYADLLDTWIATTEDAIDVIKGDKEDFHINYQVGDVREKMAKGKGYESFDDMMLKLGQLAQEDDTPGIKFVYNTLNSMNEDREMAQVMLDYFDEMYGGALEGDWGKVRHSIKQNPVDFVSDLSGFGELTAGLLGKWGLISPAKVQGLQNLFGAIDPYEVAINKMNKLQYGPVLKTEGWVAKTGLKVASKPFRWGKNVLSTIVNKISGISAEERKLLKENPELVEGYIKGTENRQTLVDKIKEKFNSMLNEKTKLGEVYEQFKNSAQRIITDGIFDAVNEKLAEKGIYKVNGKLQFPEIGFTEKQQAQILAAYNMLDKLQKGEASIADAWGVRRMIDSTLDWEGNTKQGLDLEAINLIKDIRRSIDDALKEQVPGFREADANYAQISSDIKEIQKDWFNKDGTIKDNAYSRVGNLTNKANKARLERLEKYLPGITNELKALAVAESLDKAGKAMVGQYANQIWGVGGGITALAGLFGGGVAVMPMILGMLGATMATPKNLAAVLKWQGKVEKPFKTIISKIENGIKLTAAEVSMLAKFLSENQEQLTQDAKYMYENGLISDEEFKVMQEKKKGLKNQFRKIEKDYKAGKISTKEYKEAKANYRKALDEAEYDVALQKAEAKGGDLEREITGEEKQRTTGKYAEKAKNIGFVTKLEQDMTKESKEAGTTVRGYTNLKEKFIALANNPTDRTAQHEFFHAVMKVVDPETRKFLLNEARKILGGKVGNGAAEEWLAESLGIYAKRGDINAGILDKVKWGEGVLVDKLRNFLQKNYEWMQNYNGDRKTINKMFDEILKDDLKIGENGMIDLSYLLKDSGDNGGIKTKNGLKNKPTNGGGATIKYSGGVKLKKDTGAVKYKADINGKSVQIDTKATSPDQLAKINSDGLSVMKSFISEKQAKKALDVSKELLDDKGNPYLWTHTNKYNAQPFTAFENFGDSKYKEFVDKEIAWVTNNEYMSKSYANWDTILADTKPTTIKEINDKTLKTEKTKGVDVPLGKDKSLKANTTYENGEELIKNGDKYELVKRNKMIYEFDASVDKILDDIDVAKEGYTWDSAVGEEEKMHPLTKEERIERLKFRIGGSYSWGKYDVEVKELPNGKTQITKSWKDGEVLKSFDSKAAALADVKASNKGRSKYHYQGIVQDVKKPLVVDMKGEGGASFWNRLGNAYDFLKKNDEAGLKKLEKVEDKLKSFVKEYTDKRQELDVEAQKLREIYSERMRNYKSPKRFDDPTITQAEKEQAMKEVNKLEEESRLAHIAKFNIVEMLWGKKPDMGPYMDWINSHKDFKELYDKVNKFVSDNKDLGQFINKPTQTDLINWLSKNGVDEATSSLLHGMRMKPLDQLSLVGALKNKSLQTNDYVFYALRKGGYDGVLFKNIVDYGAEPKGGWGMAEGGDVLAAFKSKNFKAWDNANPTDSKYISYKKDTGLKAKNGYRIDEDAKTPRKLIKDVNGISEMTSFVSEKQAKMAHDVSKELLSEDGNPYLRTHTNKYDAKQFANFENTLDSKYKQYADNEIGWFTNSKAMSDSYAEGKAKAAQTKPFKSIEELNNYAKKNPITKEFSSAGNIKNETKFEYHLEKMKANDGSDWWGLYSTKTTKKTFPSLEQMWNTYKEDWMGSSLGDMPKDSTEAIKILKEKRLGESEIKELGSGKFEVISKGDKEYVEGYDNKTQALAEGYAWMTPAKLYQYQGIITNMKKPYVVDFRDWGERGRQWNDLGTLKDFALAEGGEKIANAIKSIDNYESAKYDLIDILENSKRALLDENGRYKEGNMIEDKDYFLTNIIRNIREGTVDTLLSDGAWKGDEFASIKNDKLGDNIYPHLTYGDLYEMLQPLKDNTGLGFMDDYGTLPEVLDKMGVKGNAYNLITKMLVENEYFKGAADYFKGGETPYAGNIRINGIRDLIKKLNGIKLETNDFVKYALDDGGYDGVLFKNIRDYGGTPKEGWGQEKPADVAAIFHSRQFKAWDNANPTESKYISYKKDTKGLARKDTSSDGKKLSKGQMEYFKDSKVRDAQGRLTPVYHFTADDFNTVDFKKGSQNLFWFTSDGTASDRAQGVRPGMQRKRKDMYVDIKNPAGWEEYNKFGTDELKYRGYDGVILKNRDGSFEGFIFDKENQVKYTDNLNPTSSKDMRFKKDMGLKAKDQTQTPEFKKWFKGSKVVNEDGTPKVVYHGSKQGNFNIFDRTKIGKQTDSGMLGRGFYFSSDIDYSKTYGDTRAFYLDIKNPFEIKTEADQDRFFDLYLKDISLKHMQETQGTLKGYGDWSDEMKERNTQALRDKGYDGVIWYDRGKKEYVVFEPNQIKSATDNVGTFDKNNPDIRYKKAYHGSPADFDRFDSSHMGEGEGAQLHGWGHYVASDKDVAKKYYAEMGALKYKDKQIGGYDNLISEIEDLPTDKKNMIQHIAYEVQKKGKTASEAKNDLINSYTKDIEQLKGFIDKNEKKLEQLKKAGKTSRVDYQGMINNAKRYIDRDNLLLTITKNLDENDFSKRNLYELEIPDPIKKDTPTGSNYWEEWDSNYTKEQIEKIGKELAKKIEGKPLEQATMKDVENIAKAMHNKLSPDAQKMFVENVKEWIDKGHDIKTAIEDNMAYYTSLSSTADGWLEAAGLRPQGKYYDAIQLWRQGSQGRNIYTKISSILGSDKKASKFLESLGYDGIHYYGGRDGEAYVIFNDDNLKINDHIRYKKDKITPRDLGLGKKSGNEMSNGYNMVTKGGKPYTKATVEGLGLPHFLQKDADGKPFMMFNGSPVYPAQGEYIAGGFRGGKGFKDIYTNEYIFDKNPAYQTYEDNFNQIVANANDTAFTNNTQLLIGKSELGKDIYFTKDALKHILKDHGVFNINNLLETVNNPDYTGVEKPRVGQNGGSAGDRSFFLKEIPGTDNFFLLGIEPSGNGYNVTSFYEITSDDALSHFRMQKASSNETKFKKNVGTNGMKNNQSAANISKGNRYGLVKKIGVRAEENK